MNPLCKLSNHELETRLKDLVSKERKLLHVILEHIKEVDVRKLYLQRAYSSIYEYLVKECGYSGSAAMRRLEAARLLKDVPAVAEKIQEGSLNLSQIGELARAIKEKEKITGDKVSVLQKTKLVVAISGKTTQETQKELSMALDIALKEPEKQRVQKDDSVHLTVTFSQEQYQMLLQCKDLAAHLLQQKHLGSSWASLFEVLAQQFLHRKGHLPLKQMPSLSKSKKQVSVQDQGELNFSKILAAVTSVQIEKATPNTSASETGRINKSLTAKTKKNILLRDLCCQYIDQKTGRKCRSTYGLQIDHKTSRWAGGSHDSKNLQALCSRHNIFKYQQEAQIKLL